MILSGAGGFNRCSEVVLVVLAPKPPQPAVADTENCTGTPDVAVPPDVELGVIQPAEGFVTVSIVKGVPPVAEEVIETFCAVPGAYVAGAPGVLTQTRDIDDGVDERPEVVAVTVMFVVIVASGPEPV